MADSMEGQSFESSDPVTLLTKWTTPNVKLLIYIRKESDKLFHTGVLRKKAIWSRIANKVNDVVGGGVFTTGEQRQSKWKKLEQKYKEVKFHNNQSGSDLKVWEFYDLMENVMGKSPNVAPVCTMNSMKGSVQERDTNGNGNDITSQHEEEKEEDRKKKKRKSRSTSSAVVEFLNKHSTENETKEKERIDMLKRMHDDKMEVMNRFLTIMERQYQA